MKKLMMILLFFVTHTALLLSVHPFAGLQWYHLPLLVPVMCGIALKYKVEKTLEKFVKKKKRKHACQQSCEQSPNNDNQESNNPENVQPHNSRKEQEQAALLLEEIHEGNLKVIQQYLAQGIDVNQAVYIENRGLLFIPLHAATDAGYYDIVEAFLDAGANVNIDYIDKNLQPTLHVAVSKGYTDITLLLIKKGADINARDYYDRTPLHEATAHNFIGMIKLLLENGADTTLRDNAGCTPYDLAIKHGHKEAAQLLAKHENRKK